MMRRALLLSGSLGAGHEMHARASAASLAGRGWDTEILDAMQLLGPRGGSAGEAVFRAMLATPGLFDAFHFAALRPGSRLALLADAGARRQLVPRLRDYLDAHPAVSARAKPLSMSRPDDSTVSLESVPRDVFALCERVALRLKRQELAAKSVTLKLRLPDFKLRTRTRSSPAPCASSA